MNSGQNIDYTIMINGLDLGGEEKNKMAIASAYPFDAAIIMKAYEDDTINGLSAPVIPVPPSAAGPVAQTLKDKGNILFG